MGKGQTLEFKKVNGRAFARIIEANTGEEMWRTRGVAENLDEVWDKDYMHQVDASLNEYKDIDDFINRWDEVKDPKIDKDEGNE